MSGWISDAGSGERRGRSPSAGSQEEPTVAFKFCKRQGQTERSNGVLGRDLGSKKHSIRKRQSVLGAVSKWVWRKPGAKAGFHF